MKHLSEIILRRLTFAACVLFFFVAYKCTSQVKPMRFTTQNEVIYVITDHSAITAYFSKDHTSDYKLTLWLINGLHFDIKSTQTGVVREYPLSADQYRMLQTMKFDSIVFESAGTILGCYDVLTKDYFIKNLNQD